MNRVFNWIWRGLLGSGVIEYTGVKDWFIRCVMVRVGLAGLALVVSITLAFVFGSGIDEYDWTTTWMVHGLIALNLFFAAILCFGSGRNYERVVAARANTLREAPGPRPSGIESFPQHPVETLPDSSLERELKALLQAPPGDSDYALRRRADITTELVGRKRT